MKTATFTQSFLYCPQCGGDFIEHDFKSKKCLACGFVYYFNPAAALVAIIKNKQGEILVSTRAFNPAKGSLDLPGGFVDSGECAEEGLRRELREECQLEVTSMRYLFSLPNQYCYSGFEVHTLDMFFECEVEDLRGICACDDVASLQFIAPEAIDPRQFGLKSIRQGIERYIAEA